MDRENVRKIIKLLIKDINNRLKDRFIKIEFSDEALELVMNRGYDMHYGARPLKRFLQKTLETNISKLILAGEIIDGDNIKVEAADGELRFLKK